MLYLILMDFMIKR